MGLLFAKLWSLFGNEEHKIVIVGLDNAGKTTILYQFLMNEVVHTSPTIGSNVEEVVWRNIHFIMWDLGGQQSLRAAWSTYYTNTEFVIVVIDSTDKERLITIREELHKMLSHEELSKAGVLIYANKQDIKGSMTATEISRQLDLTSIKKQQWHIQSCCALTAVMEEESVFNKARILNIKILSMEVLLKNLDLVELDKASKTLFSLAWVSGERNLATFLDIYKNPLKGLSDCYKHILFNLPCCNLSEGDANVILTILKLLNVRYILALQGDTSSRIESEFKYAIDLVKYINKDFNGWFKVGVAAYPQGHPASLNFEEDLIFLKNKVHAGADFVITQMVFDYDIFNHFYKAFKIICPDTPVLVGVFILAKYEYYEVAKKLVGRELPSFVTEVVTKNKKNPTAILNFGIHLAATFIKDVLRNCDSQISGIHFFSFNNFELVRSVCKLAGLSEVHVERPLNSSSCSYFILKDTDEASSSIE
ncbi:hypothetical protein FQA39_LY15309 [Lamprigera yunnana]|nr:hypothetical protein FQA39_LY15309 [Lamprigera yunnana]